MRVDRAAAVQLSSATHFLVQIEYPGSASLNGREGIMGNTGKRCTEAQIIASLKEAELPRRTP